MVKAVARVVESRTTLWISVVILAWLVAVPEYQHWRQNRLLAEHAASTYLEVRSVWAGNITQGEPLILSVDRTIHRPFVGTFRAEVRTFPGQTFVCGGSGDIAYTPASTLPDPLTLAWWTYDDKCTGALLPPADLILTTTWTIHSPAAGVPDQTLTVESNPFTVWAIDPAAAQQAIDGQADLQQRVLGLERQMQSIGLEN